MTRDELIEELKKAPSNGEVVVVFSRKDECDACGYTLDNYSQYLTVDRMRTIPNIVIECI
jgi:hypothetical protein